MRFIRKNGRVIPIKDRITEGAKGAGIGAVAGAAYGLGHQAASVVALHMKLRKMYETVPIRHTGIPTFLGKGAVKGALIGAVAGGLIMAVTGGTKQKPPPKSERLTLKQARLRGLRQATREHNEFKDTPVFRWSKGGTK